jgi:hypothetical protein
MTEADASAPHGLGRRTLLTAGSLAAAAVAVGTSSTTRADAATVQQSPQSIDDAPTGVSDRSYARANSFNFAPSSRLVRPVAVYATTGTVRGAKGLLAHPPGSVASLKGEGASVTYDFGKEVGGFVGLSFTEGTSAGQQIGLTYAELSTYVSTTNSDGSNGGSNNEPAVVYKAPRNGQLTTRTATPVAGTSDAALADPRSQLRGGFRYLTIVNQTGGTVALDDVTVEITFAPSMPDLRHYPNYFHCSDDVLNKVWYGGAYTVQTNIIANDEGRVWPAPSVGWNNHAKIGESGSTVLVDGAKRDRTVWPGDLGISVLTDFVALNDMDTVRNSLQTLYNHQAASGALPFAGPAVNFIGFSDAYHMWVLIGTASYLRFTGDTDWISKIYSRFKSALTWVTAKIDTDGLLNVTATGDWARTDSNGKYIEAQAIMYRLLTVAPDVATAAGDPATAQSCATKAAALKAAVEGAGYWDDSVGLYRDKPTNTLYPQDGNALMVWFDAVPSADRAKRVSTALAARWTRYGAPTPEKSATSIHPFPGGMEVHAHFCAGRGASGVDLIRREWGYMLDASFGTRSTFWEGYLTDGTPDYNGSYMSAAHGWSTGPTSALTYYVAGIRPAAQGGGYVVGPKTSGLTSAEGRLTVPEGTIEVAWTSAGNGRFQLQVTAPAGTIATIEVPAASNSRITYNGSRIKPSRVVDGVAQLTALRAEQHVVQVG